MKKASYRLTENGDFIVENYSLAPAFSSFFPGIAGLYGIPLWAFYVNRGQCIASFGVEDKDGAILEFAPANQSYYLTPLKGFRTFLKFKNGLIYEPFVDTYPLNKTASTRMIISPCKLEIEERNAAVGILTKITYITVPNEPFAGLMRKLSISSICGKKLSFEIIDGLPQIMPCGVNAWHQKYMSRTIEAWIRVNNLKSKAPFYALKVNPADKPELEYIKRGNFYLAYELTSRGARQLGAIVDPDVVFGKEADFAYPRRFAEKANFRIPAAQRQEGKTPSAMTYADCVLLPGNSFEIVSLTGNVASAAEINHKAKSIVSRGFFARKLTENQKIIGQLLNATFSKTANREFDFYARQTFLDNLLRGGYPYSFKTNGSALVFYLYARKHGDLERDYNAFRLEPAYFSQGNGAFRDINQNRRNDTLFNADVKEENIHTFINAIQPDGFNPLLINGVSLHIKKGADLDKLLRGRLSDGTQINRLKTFLSAGFDPGKLISFLEENKIAAGAKADLLLKDILHICVKEDIIRPGEGYWIDHWTYNLDLIEKYLDVYPEKLEDILITDQTFSFYDSYSKVMPRDKKYVLINSHVRQYGAVVEDEEKECLIHSRKHQAYKVRTKHGRGNVYHTNLLVKLLNLSLNKIASLDPFGTGIEMEANKPGWCDSLNNMPGVFGSSVSETAELKRLISFINSALKTLKLDESFKLKVPLEMAQFFQEILHQLKIGLSSSSRKKEFIYWDRATTIKEQYRAKVWPGFKGEERLLSLKKISKFLSLADKKLNQALNKSIDKRTGIPRTYFIHQVTRYKKLPGRRIKVLGFKQRPIAYFLEAPVHMMKVLNPSQCKKLYQSVKNSGLFDKKLKMYKINDSLKGMPAELGRSTVFTPGWLENESIWLHMEYKYLWEILKAGLYEQFFEDIKHQLIAFLKPEVYGRSILEGSSFIVSSAHPENSLHGRGFAARLSGLTTEFLSIWLHMAFGQKPFSLDKSNGLQLIFKPVLPAWLFTKEDSNQSFYFDNQKKEIIIPKNSAAFCFLGKTIVVYHNPQRKNTFGANRAWIKKIILAKKNKQKIVINSEVIISKYAKLVRHGEIEKIDVILG